MAKAERVEVVDVPLRIFYETVKDFEKYPHFISGFSSARFDPSDSRRVFFEVDFMKPVKYSIEVRDSITADELSAEVSWTLHEGDILKLNNGIWTLKSKGPLTTEVNYSLEVEFKIPVPGFILKGVVKNSLPKAIQDVANEAKRRKGR